ncbi:MAG: hypothetical protein ACRDZW_06255 [Acidimicrobiales bacterium]
MVMDERPPLDPEKLLASWMQWEKGDLTPGKVMSELKRGGLRDLLESTIQARQEIAAS